MHTYSLVSKQMLLTDRVSLVFGIAALAQRAVGVQLNITRWNMEKIKN